MSGLTFLVLALACYRLTRLAVEDEVTRPARNRVIEWAYTRQGHDRDNVFGDPDPRDDHTTVVLDDDAPPKLAYLLSCSWCASMWCALLLVAVEAVWTVPVVVLAVAGAGALIAATANRLDL